MNTGSSRGLCALLMLSVIYSMQLTGSLLFSKWKEKMTLQNLLHFKIGNLKFFYTLCRILRLRDVADRKKKKGKVVL